MPLSGRPKMLTIVTLVMGLGTLLAGCVHDKDGFATFQGPRDAFPPPEYQIKGETNFDQKWIDETTEAGVAGLGWKRPKPRPASLSKPTAPAVTVKKESKTTRLKRYLKNKFLSNRFQELAK